MKKRKAVVLSVLLLIIALSAGASMSRLWTSPSGDAADAPGVIPGAGGGSTQGPGYRIAEPATILVLGGGLIFMGLYARLKRAK